MQEVVRQLSERLATSGHEITVAATSSDLRKTKVINGVCIEEFDILGNSVAGYKAKPREIERYRKFLAESAFDVISIFAAQWWGFDIAAEILENITPAKIFVPTGFSHLNNPSYKRYFRNMKAWLQCFDANIFLSHIYQDILFARQAEIGNCIVIPNGADEREFLSREKSSDFRARSGIPKNHKLVLHVGSHTGQKGHSEALQIFARSKIRETTLLLIGAKGAAFGCLDFCRKTAEALNSSIRFMADKKRIILAELPRDDVVNAFLEADLFLFPSNIECSPIVLFEACASHTPFLATDVGNSREIAEWTGGGFILPTSSLPWHKPKEAIKELVRLCLHPLGLPVATPRKARFADVEKSARMLTSLINNKLQRQKIAQNGYEGWKDKFTWEIISRRYEALYFSVCKRD